MGVPEKIEHDYREAFRAGNQAVVAVLRALKSALKNEEIAKRQPSLTEPEVAAVLTRELKQRRDASALYEKGGRPELAAHEQAEIQVIEQYLPAALTPAELEEVVRQAITAVQATGPKDTGKVMGAVMPKTQGRIDGSAVRALVQKILAG